MRELVEYVRGRIWILAYPIRLAGVGFDARMTVLKLGDGRLWVHSPAPADAETTARVRAIGQVGALVAPGNFHHLNLVAWQRAFPEAKTYLCPGVERKVAGLHFAEILGDIAPAAWKEELDQALIRGGRIMSEVAFFDYLSKTLILVDSIENIGERTPNLSWTMRALWRAFGMWNRALPAPEYRIGWSDLPAARASFERILAWDFERIVLSHGDLIEKDAKAVAQSAWDRVLRART